MKRFILLGLALVLILLFTVSCGGGGFDDLYTMASIDLNAAQAQVQQLQNKIAKAGTEIKIINSIFIPSIKGEITPDEMVSLFGEWQGKIDAMGDTALQAKFKAITESGDTAGATQEFFLYLFNDIQATLD
jgi:hypothetical protein